MKSLKKKKKKKKLLNSSRGSLQRLPMVPSDVGFQITAVTAAIGAELTLERFLPRVDAEVSSEISPLRSGIATHHTHVGAFG